MKCLQNFNAQKKNVEKKTMFPYLFESSSCRNKTHFCLGICWNPKPTFFCVSRCVSKNYCVTFVLDSEMYFKNARKKKFLQINYQLQRKDKRIVLLFFPRLFSFCQTPNSPNELAHITLKAKDEKNYKIQRRRLNINH